MSDIIELELKNLKSWEKERLFQELAGKAKKGEDLLGKLGKKYPKRVQLNKNYKTFEKYAGNVSKLSEEQKKQKLEEYQKWLDFNKYNKYKFDPEFLSGATQYYDELDQVLGAYFKDYPDEFITFQTDFEHSVYNQTLKQHDFKDFDYKDVIKDLTQEQKDEIVSKIPRLFQELVPQLGVDDVLLDTIDPESGKFSELKENLYDGQKNKHALLSYPHGGSYYIPLKFFKDDNQLIHYALKQPVSANPLLHDYNEILNPKHKVNEWIVTNHELELTQTSDLEQTQKFDEPKKKMKM
ncbi:hypothetical protein [Mesomycoplasma ovipneumoniae]|uniref:hypothetical protein n=1 Tax=Mesomycoplasma ovipneumoniae TaxID=29562 RepID=UPI00083E7139|nr:hypothetical protein [Mesomycoplasma ovipneumoniae]